MNNLKIFNAKMDEEYIKRREFLPNYGFISHRNMT